MTLTDPQIANPFAHGLFHGMFARDHMIEWADREILLRASVPMWVVNLSMSRDTMVLDLIGQLRDGFDPFAPDEALRITFALLPADLTFSIEACAFVAAQMYKIARDELDWDSPHLMKLRSLHEEYWALEDGYSGATSQSLARDVKELVRSYHDPDAVARIRPVRWIIGGVPLVY